MPLIASINGLTRRIYLDAAMAIGGVLSFHPTIDLYPAYRALRRTNEAYRPYDALMAASGNEAKNQDGSKRTPRFTRLLLGAKLVIPAGVTRINVTGELLTDDGSDPFDRSLVSGPLFIDYTPAEAEIIRVISGSGVTTEDKAAIVASTVSAVLAALNATTIPVDLKKVKGQTIAGNGIAADPWRPA